MANRGVQLVKNPYPWRQEAVPIYGPPRCLAFHHDSPGCQGLGYGRALLLVVVYYKEESVTSTTTTTTTGQEEEEKETLATITSGLHRPPSLFKSPR